MKTALLLLSLLTLFRASAFAMTPPASAASITPRAANLAFGTASGEGLGISLFTRRSSRDVLRSGDQDVPNPNHERQLNQRVDLLLDYRILDRTSLILDVPFIHNSAQSDTTIRRRVDSIGDIALYSKYALYRNRVFNPTQEVSFVAGVKMPSGPSSLKDAAGTRLDATFQPGSGSTDFIAGLSGSWSLRRAVLYADASYKYNTHTAYTFGDTFNADLGIQSPLKVAPRLSLTAEADVEVVERDHSIENLASILPGGGVENTGHRALFFTPGFQYRPIDKITLSFSVQVPVYQNFSGTQLASGPNINLAVFTRIGG